MLTRFLMAGLLVLGLSSGAQAADRVDLQTFRDISNQVLRYSHFTIFDSVHAAVDNGIVTLTGKVTMPYKRADIEKRVAEVRGVREIQNRIEVLPVSQMDNELRFQISRAIYGNSAFWNYAAMVNPPIHVIVERGRVTLEGVVNSDVDRMLARSLASSFGAFSVTNELKTEAEMRQELERM
ncbi:MAG TPA: BON domain-containing protein [Vicinamibacterales bacterium]|nr:BON domain-containing protein [Vicinamibacterales bacterium]